MSTFDKNMDKFFDVQTTSTEIVEKKVDKLPATIVDTADLKQDLDDAYDQTKSNLQDLIENGKDAMEELLQIAKAGQHPRAFEVYATLLKNVGELNDKLLDNQKKMRTMDGPIKSNDSPKTNIEQALFVGSTTELQKFLKNNGNN